MKKMRRLIPAIAMLLVSAVMLSTASFAWFTISTTASATGMKVSAAADSSLLITDSKTEATKWLSATGTVSLTDQNVGNTDLVPATHDDDYDNGLKVVADPALVDPASGAYDDDAGYTDSTAANFIDYTVYIGTTGEAMTNKTLTAEVSVAQLKYALHNAVSIDFIVNDNYGGTLNLAAANANATATAAGTASTAIATNLNIPVSVVVNDAGESSYTQECVTIVMRVYFDGALPDGNGEYYVQNTSATTQEIGFSVKFSVN